MYKAHTEIYDEVHHHLDYALAAETLLALIERVRPGAGSLSLTSAAARVVTFN